MPDRRALLVACFVCAGCSAPRAVTTRFDAVLDSLAPGLRLGATAAAVRRQVPSLEMTAARDVERAVDHPRFGHIGLSLAFADVTAPANAEFSESKSGLQAVTVTLPSDSQYVRAVGLLERWLGTPPDTVCVGAGAGVARWLRWRSDHAALLEAAPPGNGSPGMLEFITVPWDSVLAPYAPKFVACPA